MMDELEDLQRAHNGLSDKEWWFWETETFTVMGNVVFCMTTSRYGEEVARIRNGNQRELSLLANKHE